MLGFHLLQYALLRSVLERLHQLFDDLLGVAANCRRRHVVFDMRAQHSFIDLAECSLDRLDLFQHVHTVNAWVLEHAQYALQVTLGALEPPDRVLTNRGV